MVTGEFLHVPKDFDPSLFRVPARWEQRSVVDDGSPAGPKISAERQNYIALDAGSMNYLFGSLA